MGALNPCGLLIDNIISEVKLESYFAGPAKTTRSDDIWCDNDLSSAQKVSALHKNGSGLPASFFQSVKGEGGT